MNTIYACKYALQLCTFLCICTILLISCDDNPTESSSNPIFVYRFVDTELFGNDIDAAITFVTDTLQDEHGYYYTVEMPTVNILLKDSSLIVEDELLFYVSYDKNNYSMEGGFVSGRYIFRNRIIFTYTPRLAGYDKLWIKGENYNGSKLFFEVCVKFK